MIAFFVAWLLSHACPTETAWTERTADGATWEAMCGDAAGESAAPLAYFYARTVTVTAGSHLDRSSEFTLRRRVQGRIERARALDRVQGMAHR